MELLGLRSADKWERNAGAPTLRRIRSGLRDEEFYLRPAECEMQDITRRDPTAL